MKNYIGKWFLVLGLVIIILLAVMYVIDQFTEPVKANQQDTFVVSFTYINEGMMMVDIPSMHTSYYIAIPNEHGGSTLYIAK